ncbi:MAG: hypothetical protein QOE90_1303 [Thermoplasmata archaeon]|jgi:peptidoglycan/xylan/chitin deacetylase (PgdA/CDA1 family)|nr:hypothetical protein [Thermoplasmata archaeon]
MNASTTLRLLTHKADGMRADPRPVPLARKSRVALLLAGLLLPIVPVASAPPPPTSARVVFTFDSGYATHLEAASILEDDGLRGTFYVISDFLRQEPYYTAFLNASEVASLAARGHDVESHTATHPDLTTVSDARLSAELAGSATTLSSIVGRPVRHLAYPYGATNAHVDAAANATYDSTLILAARAEDAIAAGASSRLVAFVVTRSTSLENVTAAVDLAQARQAVLVLSFQSITPTPDAYDWTPEQLRKLADYVAQKGVDVSTVAALYAGDAAWSAGPQVTARAVGACVALAWSAPPSRGRTLTGYDVYRNDSSGRPVWLATVGATASFVDSEIRPNVSYRYQVAARDDLGLSPFSAVTASTPNASRAGHGRIAFTFDTGYVSALDAASILEANGFRGTFYVTSGFLSPGNASTEYLSASQVADLARRGHEIGAHGATKTDLTTLSPAALDAELSGSQDVLANVTGRAIRHMSYPYDGYNATVVAAVAARYQSGRRLVDTADAALAPSDPYLLPGLVVTNGTSVAALEAAVDLAVERDRPLVLSFQRIVPSAGPWDWTPEKLAALASYAQAIGVDVVTVDELVPASGSAPPAAPFLSAHADPAVVRLSWPTPLAHGSPVTGYVVDRAAASQPFTRLASLGPVNRYVDASAAPGATYTYRVAALNAAGQGPFSANASASPRAASSGGRIVLTFDDGRVSVRNATAILEARGLRGTFFAIAGDARNGACFNGSISRTQIADLARRGEDMESHTFTHPHLTTLTDAALAAEMRDARLVLENETGMPVRHVAYPFGEEDARVRAAAASVYASARGYSSAMVPAVQSADPYAVPGAGVERPLSAQAAEGLVDDALARNATLVLVLHDVRDRPGYYGWTPQSLAELADHLVSVNATVQTYAEAFG